MNWASGTHFLFRILTDSQFYILIGVQLFVLVAHYFRQLGINFGIQNSIYLSNNSGSIPITLVCSVY